jgi:hypothetical protein
MIDTSTSSLAPSLNSMMKSQSLRLLGSAHPIAVDPNMLESEIFALDDTRDDDNTSIQIPIERTIPRCHSAGCIEGQVERLGSTEYRRQYLMSLQIHGKKHPLFIAEKEQSSRTIATGTVTRFIIRQVQDDAVLGLLTKSGTARDAAISYTLNHRKSKECPIAYIRYEVPSVIQVLTESPPRRAFIEVPGRGSVETKEPGSKDGGIKSLNFRGRGKEASRKNMQLHNRDGRVVLQFVKWGTHLFHLDFA